MDVQIFAAGNHGQQAIARDKCGDAVEKNKIGMTVVRRMPRARVYRGHFLTARLNSRRHLYPVLRTGEAGTL